MRALLRLFQNRLVAKQTGSESDPQKEISFMSPRRRGRIQLPGRGSMCFLL